LKAKWKAKWEKSHRAPKFAALESKVPFANFLKSTTELKKRDSSILMQLRTQHVPLNSYLHRFKRADTSHCTACIRNNRIWVRETLNHFLFVCPSWRPQRSILQSNIEKWRSKSLQIMLSEKEYTKELLTFVHSTGRFRKKQGEV
ncbi:hypothetical protein BDN72DRAFT_739796, partial [Pluteus cervinus]